MFISPGLNTSAEKKTAHRNATPRRKIDTGIHNPHGGYTNINISKYLTDKLQRVKNYEMIKLKPEARSMSL
jgi:hypothetical protein